MEKIGIIPQLMMAISLIFYFWKLDPMLQKWLGKKLHVKLDTGTQGVWIIKGKIDPSKKLSTYIIINLVRYFFIMIAIMGIVYTTYFFNEFIEYLLQQYL